jgi:geranylgeranyl pyrophosphate synthase
VTPRSVAAPEALAAPEAPLLAALDAALAPGGAAALDPAVPTAVWAAALAGPAAAFLARPGKDLRARLVRAGWRLGGAHAHDAHASASASAAPAVRGIELAIELVHAGSLIVDDVEDGSEERRGGPALHRLVGAPLAINTGSWMYFWALAELARLGVPGAVERAAAALARCHQGQALDLATRVVDLEPRDVPAVVAATTRLKTGALCRLAVELGALAAGAAAARVAALADLGEAIGCALQMLDDLGGLAAAPAAGPDARSRRAKGHEDLREARPTWPWAWLAEQHDPFAWARLVGQARAVTAGADPGPLAEALAERIDPIGRARARATLDAALAAARAALARDPAGDAARPALDELTADLRRMETMYG